MNTLLKKALMRKAKNEGMNLSTVLNIAARAYVGDRLKITALDKDIDEGLEDIRRGRTISQEDLFKKLGF